MNGKHNEPEIKKVEITAKGIDVLPADPSAISNLNLPTLFADVISVMARSDGISVLRFFSRIPGANVEISRIAIQQNVLSLLLI